MRCEAESFLHRWSRRKQAMQQPEPAAPDESQALAQPAVETALTRSDGPLSDPSPASLPDSPPRLEDLTAESKLIAFLREGVPDALRSAALRKMWSLDPAIRDHVGLAECAWDFNRPESIPGFGSLAKTFAPEFLSHGPTAGSAAPDVAPSSLRPPDLEAKSIAARAPPDEPDAVPMQEGARIDGNAGFEPDVADRRAAAYRHGSALPRSGG